MLTWNEANDKLKKEIEYFKTIKDQLFKDHLGKWVVIDNQKLFDVYSTFEEAFEKAAPKFQGAFLIQQVDHPENLKKWQRLIWE